MGNKRQEYVQRNKLYVIHRELDELGQQRAIVRMYTCNEATLERIRQHNERRLREMESRG